MQYKELPLGERYGRLDCYVPGREISGGKGKRRPAIIICPGGGYLKLATREGEPVAMRFLGLGYAAFVCRYPTYVTAPPKTGETYPQVNEESHYPVQAASLMRAIAYVRTHAEQLSVDAERIYALGFSAGGHVVGTVAECWDDPELLALTEATPALTKPSGVVLCYPMVNAELVHDTQALVGGDAGRLMEVLERRGIFGKDNPTDKDFQLLDLTQHVRSDMPRTFVWQTAEDDMLRVADTAALVQQLLLAKVSCEFHLFERGVHGMALADETSASKPEDVNAEAARWVELAAAWLALDGSPEVYEI